MEVPELMTETEVADLLGVPIESVALWAREGRLLAAARTEGGQLLFYRWRVEGDGFALAAFAPTRTAPRATRRSSLPPPPLACGCRLDPAPGHLCRTGAGLLAAASLAEELATRAPHDALFARLADLSRDALSGHLTGRRSERQNSPKLVSAATETVEELDGRRGAP